MPRTGTLARGACRMSLALLAACGFHEMAIVGGLGDVTRLSWPRRLHQLDVPAASLVFLAKSLYVLPVRHPAGAVRSRGLPETCLRPIQEYTFSTSDGLPGGRRACDVGQPLCATTAHPSAVHPVAGALLHWRVSACGGRTGLQFALLAAQLGCFGLRPDGDAKYDIPETCG
jgi:hypothetical protein